MGEANEVCLLFFINYLLRKNNNKYCHFDKSIGGLKEWNTDMPIDAEFILDKNAQELADEAAKSSTCIPIGEGENCW